MLFLGVPASFTSCIFGFFELVTRSYDLVVRTFDVFWDLFQVLFSGFISGLEGWGVQVGVGFLSMF